jgi:hypothetical protein
MPNAPGWFIEVTDGRPVRCDECARAARRNGIDEVTDADAFDVWRHHVLELVEDLVKTTPPAARGRRALPGAALMLLFHEEFRAPIIRRAKTVTRRSNLAWRLKTIKVGRVHGAYVRPPWMGGEPFAQLLILGVTESDFLTVDEREARREGVSERPGHARLPA